MKHIKENLKKINCLLTMILLTLVFCVNLVEANGERHASISPDITFGEFVALTSGSSSTLHVKTNGDFTFDFNHLFNVNTTVVLCLGEGTLNVDLTKDDTEKDLVSMLIIGFPADLLFSPNFGFTPAVISSSANIQDTFGVFAIVLIVSGVHSDREPPHEYTLSLGLDKNNNTYLS
jgi:hypothetical protein